ncbi:MAG: glycosyltransferase family 2 protein [Hyphomicrobiales bacterium]|nr:glycosyltransferase family 2 protein [Hyphomicrobiales bacterium]
MNAPFPHPDGTPEATQAPQDVCIATVALIVPVRDEEDAIAPFLESVYRNTEVLTEQGIAFEFIFINDGSADATLDCLLLAQKDDPRVRIVDLSRSFGPEAALTAGLDLCDSDAAIPIGVDLLDPPHVIPDLIAKWREGFEVVLTRRIGPRATQRRATLGERIHNMVAVRKIPEGVGDFRLIDRNVVEALRAMPERRRLMRGLFAWVGFRTTTIDYEVEPDAKSKAPARSLLGRGSREGMTSFSSAPLEAWTWVGATVAALSFLCGLGIVAKTLVFGADVPGYATLMVGVLLLGGMQLLGIGIVCKYLANLHTEIKQRPVYLVRRTYGPA